MGRFVVPRSKAGVDLRGTDAPFPGRAFPRLAWIAGIGSLLLLASLSAVAWRHYFSPPPPEPLVVPADLVPLQSTLGRKLLVESDAQADYPELAANFVTQSRRSYCGVASSVIVFNALHDPRPRLDQSSYFDGPVGLTSFDVSLTGMSLHQLSDGLRAHGVRAEPVYAGDTDAASFRTRAARNLRTDGDFLLVNYQRAVLGQIESGHISPVAAFHAGTDRLLVMDVASYRYPPVWVPVDKLWDAMRSPLNAKTQRTRGFVEVGGISREVATASADGGQGVAVRD
ncbi:MAG TPA: phytochelatin synthase family protein [Pseudoxanthomonas sp.]|nr:phytochelatin synthase family protein [Pseudoxanthomonas sp.]